MKKQNYILTILLVLFAAVASFGQTTAELDKVSSFHGMRFGSHLTKHSPVVMTEHNGAFAMYEVTGDASYGVLSLDEADILTKDDEIVAFQLKFTGQSQARQLLLQLAKQWGEPKFDGNDSSLNWTGKKNGAIVTYNGDTGQFTLTVIHLQEMRYTETSL